MLRGSTEMEILRLNGWDKIGTILIGTEYYGDGQCHTDKIRITGLGEEGFLCRWQYQDKEEWSEEKGNTTLRCREWEFYESCFTIEDFISENIMEDEKRKKVIEKTKLEVQGIVNIFDTEFNVGDEVFSSLYGWGNVVDYDEKNDYPVYVTMTSKYKTASILQLEYTADGRNFRDEDKSLFHSKEEALLHIGSLVKTFVPLTFDFIKENCVIGETVFQYSTPLDTYEFTYFGFTLSGWLVTEDKHTAHDNDLHGLQFWQEFQLQNRKLAIKE